MTKVRLVILAILASALPLAAGPRVAAGGHPGALAGERPDTPRAGHVLDGSYVVNVGELQVNITNHGLIGSRYSQVSTYSEAPSGQWPAGSGNEYLWAAGLWVGAIINGEPHVSTGQYEREFRPLDMPQATIYEARAGAVVRPLSLGGVHGRRLPDPQDDDDGDGWSDEETLDGLDNDEDGMVDEDFGQLGSQMLVCTMVDNTALAAELYPDHQPLNLQVVQTAFAWDGSGYRDFVALDFEITNIGTTPLADLYVGLLVDCDIGPRTRADSAMDDLAGSFSGFVEASDHTYRRVQVAYMRDGATENPLPGWFGVMAVSPASFRSIQCFPADVPYEFGGAPIGDEQRFAVLGRTRNAPDVPLHEANDYHLLVSLGPWSALAPGQKISVSLALVVGNGRQELLRHCADVHTAAEGLYFNLDAVDTTGTNGRETRFCYPELPPAGDPIYSHDADYMDESCLGPTVHRRLIRPNDFSPQENGQYCIWVNLDNCQECDRLSPSHCTAADHNFEDHWICNQWWRPVQQLGGCTGVGGAESRVPWLLERLPPPPPGLRVVPASNAVHVYWNDASEHDLDPQMRVPDFESYRVWRADDWRRPQGSSLENGPESASWQLLAEFDLVNDCVLEHGSAGAAQLDTVALGRNTGLESIVYHPVCLEDPRFVGLGAAMQAVVDADVAGRYQKRPPLRSVDGLPVPGLEALLPWEAHPTELDTFFMVATRAGDPANGVAAKPATRFYEFVDRLVHNGFLYFYSVTATDHRLTWRDGPVVSGPGREGSPNMSFAHAVPGTPAQTLADRAGRGADIYVYPNPATTRSLQEFQQFAPNADDPTGQRVMFANLPACRNRITIFTLDGDLVQELWHDGTTGHGEMPWNLVSRNGQEVVAGIYIYVVQPVDKRFEAFRGKFVVIK